MSFVSGVFVKDCSCEIGVVLNNFIGVLYIYILLALNCGFPRVNIRRFCQPILDVGPSAIFQTSQRIQYTDSYFVENQ